MASQVWSGHLNFALISIPVRLTPAARAQGISFNMLHRDDLHRINQQLVCSSEQCGGTVVQRSEIVKGFEYKKGEYVVVEPEDIKKIEPQTSKVMQVLEFVDANEVDPVYFDASYYLTPEEAGISAYKLLVKAMEFGKYYGIAKLFMHNREHTVVIRQSGDLLMLHTMFYRNEVRIFKEFDNHKDQEPKLEEVDAAMKLIVAMTNQWDPGKYYDGFQESLKAMIKAKLEGQEVAKLPELPKPKPVPNIMDAINKSLAEIKAKKGAK